MININIKNIDKSLDYILKNKCSIARFGDGEIDIISGQSIPYQEYNEELANSLKEIISLNSTENFMVCLSDVFTNLERYNSNFHYFWNNHLEKFGYIYKQYCVAPWYGSTFISRPYIDLQDKSNSSQYFFKLKKLWDKKDIVIVEGITSRSGVGNDLFDNANSINRIICPSKNAYSHKQWIIDNIRLFGKDKLILLMLGPTAKVISYELHKEGYQLLDLGHIDSEYEWFKMGANHKVKLQNKHTAEHNFDENIIFEDSKDYNIQIIAKYDEKKISIILPIIDSEYSNDNTFNSIFSQYYNNWELFILDFRIEKDTNSFLQKKYNNKIKILECRNNPMLEMSKIIEDCNGEYVTIINSGDILDANYFSNLKDQFNREKDIIILDENLNQDFLDISLQETKELNINSLTSKFFKLNLLKDLGIFSLPDEEILHHIINKSTNNVLIRNQNNYIIVNKFNIFRKIVDIIKKISIVIPVSCETIHLSKCLDSIRKQNYQNLEIVIVLSDKKLYNYYLNMNLDLSNIKLIFDDKVEIKNIVSGQFVVFLDSNNWLSEDFIYQLLRQQQFNSADIVMCNYIKYEENTKLFYYHNMDSQFFIKELHKPISTLSQDLFFTNKNYAKLIKKDLVDKFTVDNIFNDFEIGKLFKLSSKSIFINGNYHYVRLLEAAININNNHSKNAVVYIVRGKHVQLLAVSLASLIKNYKNEENLDIILIVDKIYFKDKEMLESIPKMYNSPNVNIIIKKPPKISEELNDVKTEIGEIVLWRLFIPFEFSYYDQLLYLDNDTIFYGDVTEYFELTDEDKYIGAVKDFYFYVDSNVQNYNNMYGVKNIKNYVNAGVIVFNVNNFVSNINKEFLLEKIKTNSYSWPDQTILNIICEGNISYLPLEYNYQKNDYWLYNWAIQRHKSSAEDIIQARNNVKLRHFIMYENDSMPWEHLTLVDEFEMDFYDYLYSIKQYQYNKNKIKN